MKLAYEPINENEISIREINLNDTRKIGYYYGIDKIHLYTPVQNTEIPQKLFREISRKKKSSIGSGIASKDTMILNFTLIFPSLHLSYVMGPIFIQRYQ